MKNLLLLLFAVCATATISNAQTVTVNPDPIVFGDQPVDVTITVSGAASTTQFELFTNASPTTALITANAGTTPALVAVAGGVIQTITFTVVSSASPFPAPAGAVAIDPATAGFFSIFTDSGGTLTASAVTNSSLPVGISIFTGKADTEEVALAWTTDWELNNDFFTIERSFDGRTFEKVSTVAGEGTTEEATTYSFVDESVLKDATSNTAYYRLKQTDFDGQYTYSNVVALDLDIRNDLEITNAVIGGSTLEVGFNSPTDASTEVSVVNMAGQIVGYTTIEAVEGRNNAAIDLSAYNGIFVVRLTNGKSQAIRKVIK